MESMKSLRHAKWRHRNFVPSSCKSGEGMYYYAIQKIGMEILLKQET